MTLWLLCGLLAALAVGLGVYVWLVQTRPPRRVPAAAAATMPETRKALRGAAVASLPPAAPKTTRPASARAQRESLASAPATAPKVSGGRTQNAIAKDNGAASAHARAAAEQARPAPPPAPIALAAAPDAIRTAFPTINIIVHVWNADPDASFIMIGDRQFRGGDEIAPGVRLLKVTQGGEVVAFRGYRLILP